MTGTYLHQMLRPSPQYWTSSTQPLTPCLLEKHMLFGLPDVSTLLLCLYGWGRSLAVDVGVLLVGTQEVYSGTGVIKFPLVEV